MREKDPKEKKRALSGYQKNFAFLSAAIEELADFPFNADIYGYIARSVKKVTPRGTIILVNTYDPEKKVVALRSFAGTGSHLPAIERILGRPLMGISFPAPDPAMIPLRTGECTELHGGVSALTFGGLPEEACRALEALPFFGRIYGTGISWKGTLHGAVTFILPPGRELYNSRVIALFVRLVAGYLQRRQVHDDLMRSENLYRTIFDNTGTATIIVREDTVIELVNRGFETLSGYAKEDIEGKKSWTEFVVREDLDRMKRYHAMRRQDPRFIPEIYEFRYTDRYGDVRNCINHIRMIPGTTKSIASILDITDLKKTEAALSESEASYIGLFNAFKDPVFIVGRDGKFRNANRSAIAMFGYPVEFLIGKSFDALSVPGSLEPASLREHITGAFHGDSRLFGFEGRQRSGQAFPVEVSLFTGMYFGQDVLIAIAADITERKRAQEALLESEQRFRAIFENMHAGVAVYHVVGDGEDFVFKDFNPAAELISRIGRENVIGKRLLDLFPNMDRFGLFAALQRVSRTGMPEHLPAAHYMDPYREGWRDNHIYKLPSGDVVAIYEDVTEQKMAQEALLESEKKYRELTELLPQTVYEVDMSGRITFANRHAFEAFGYTREDFDAGLHVSQMIHPDDRDRALRDMQSILRGECVTGDGYRALRKDGTTFPVIIYGDRITRDNTVVGMRGIVADLPEHRSK